MSSISKNLKIHFCRPLISIISKKSKIYLGRASISASRCNLFPSWRLLGFLEILSIVLILFHQMFQISQISYLWFQSDLSNIFLTHLKNVGSIPPLLGAFSSFILNLTWFAWRTKYDTHIDERISEDLNRSISFKLKGQWKLVERQHHLFSILVPYIDAIVASIVVGKMSGRKNEDYTSNRYIAINMISFNP